MAGGPGLKSLNDLAREVGGRLEGPADTEISGVGSLQSAGEGDVTFIVAEEHAAAWKDSKASAAIANEQLDLQDEDPPRPIIRVEDAEQAMISVLELFESDRPMPEPGIDSTARIGRDCTIGDGCRIGTGVSIGDRCTIGNDVVIHPGVVIYGDVRIGDGCELHSNTSIRERSVLGNGVILHSGVVIGSDGFGYRPTADGSRLRKMPHVGNVFLEDMVEIGANTCIDRGKFDATVVGAGTKIDNLCQVAHNCRIGRCCVIAGSTGIAGSVTIGDGVQIGGHVGIAEHLHIGDGARIGAKSGVMKDVPAGETQVGLPAREAGQQLRTVAALNKLPDWSRKLRKLLAAED
ncbi:MAG: UDP-3-O-(3-hydroxymyristoyl)glucosamine N-acyltransferase [Phycisphaerae bacterium]|nr:UDP-3-O-(3-hydroxymyristoyl)glucosamine N-acyltransferase [Phycisphaerae bacterium]